MLPIRRLLQITAVICRYRLDLLVPHRSLPPLARQVLRFGPWRLYREPTLPAGQRLREALEDLGPIHVKFGQLLSTRPDLIPEDIAQALAGLQDAVTPFPGKQAMEIIETSYGFPLYEAFACFNETPIASASIAQVHEARLKDGREVVVKVIRPGIRDKIERDLDLLHAIARLLQRWVPEARRLHPVEVVDDYQHTLVDELDMMREAANTSQLRHNFTDSRMIYIPEVHWDYTRTNVLVMERIYGIPIAHVARLRELGTDMKVLAEKGVEIFFTQVFRDSFFHADMHPGNIFVDASNPADPRYIAIDCGIVGTLAAEDQSYLARNLLAFFKRDYRQVAELHIASGWIPAHTRVNEFESAIRTVCEPIFNRPLKDISFGQFLVRLFRTARRFDMEVQPQLVLLQKTLLNIEGLGRQLYPDLDLWNTAQPFLERWLRERIGPVGMLRTLQRNWPQWLEQSQELPDMIYEAIDQIRRLEPVERRILPARPTAGMLNPTVSRSARRALKWGITLLLAGVLAGAEALVPLVQAVHWGGWLAIAAGWILLMRAI